MFRKKSLGLVNQRGRSSRSVASGEVKALPIPVGDNPWQCIIRAPKVDRKLKVPTRERWARKTRDGTSYRRSATTALPTVRPLKDHAARAHTTCGLGKKSRGCGKWWSTLVITMRPAALSTITRHLAGRPRRQRIEIDRWRRAALRDSRGDPRAPRPRQHRRRP